MHTPHAGSWPGCRGPWQSTARALAVLVLGVFGVCGCAGDGSGDGAGSPSGADSGPLDAGRGEDDLGQPAPRRGISLLLPATLGPGLNQATTDVLAAWVAMSSDPELLFQLRTDGKPASATQYVEVLVVGGADAELDAQSYRLLDVEDGERRGLQIVAGSQIAAMYALYDLLADAGVRYLHPEEPAWYPPAVALAPLPRGYEGALRSPAFGLRGFHEHTQHPIVMSDALLRTDSAELRGFVSHTLRWLARNRQNLLTFHLLKTVDLDDWAPYMADIAREAHELGVDVGAVLSFVDQQQNCFRLIDEGALGPDGQLLSDEEQIRARLDAVLAADLDMLGLQIGSSEFTKPGDAQVLRWLDAATEHLADAHPDVQAFAWIHVTCSLRADDGEPFFHLPLQADPRLGALVHTTMFYTLTHPAPVYDCADFSHQRDFITAGRGERPLLFFPESAWWLGFDNNVPLQLPITGWSREHDLRQTLSGLDLEGHLTFTTGREWGYWQYDHYLTRATWDGAETWDAYLAWLVPSFGVQGEPLVEALQRVTELQVRHLYTEAPELYFYIAGELPQDEIGAAAGILARRPKPAFKAILELEPDAFERWEADEYGTLLRWRDEYAAALAALPADIAEGVDDEQATRRARELLRGLQLWSQRFEHTLALYGGVAAARPWWQERLAARTEGRPADGLVKEAAERGAREHLHAAQAISARVLRTLQAAEADYRYPVEWLAREKPGSLTAYPFGYLSETSDATFWVRRDEQLSALIEGLFGGVTEAWEHEPELLWVAPQEDIALTEPANPQAAALIGAFIPQMLFGLLDADAAPVAAQIVIAEDYDRTVLPDPGSEATVRGLMVEPRVWQGALERFPLVVHDTSGGVMGTIEIVAATLRLDVVVEGGRISELMSGALDGGLTTTSLLEVVTSIDGLDEEGARTLLKAIYGLDEVPEVLPFGFTFALRASVL